MDTTRPGGAGWRPVALAYMLSVTVTMGAALVVLGFAIENEKALILLLPPIILSAAVGGLGPGLTATMVAGLGAYRGFSAPPHAFVLVAIGVVISLVNGALQRWQRREADGSLLWHGFRTDMTARQQTEAALRVSEDRYRTVVEDQTELIARFTPDGVLTFVNDVACRLSGRTAQELLGNRWDLATLPEDLPIVIEQLSTMTPAKPVVVIENRVISPSGQIHWMHFVNRGFFDRDNQLIEIQAVGLDITERKRAETLLRESEAKFRSYVELAPVGVVVADRTGRHVEANRAAHELLGYDDGELLNMYAIELLAEDDVEAAQRFFSFLSQTGHADGALRLRRHDGAAIHAAVRAVKLDDDRFLATFRDVTQQVRTEERLRLSEERLELAMRGANDGLWDWNLKTGDAYYSPRWKSMLGYAEDELENVPDTWMRVIHPEDLEPALTVMRNLVEARSDKFELEFRAQHKDGHCVDILSRGFLSLDGQDEIVRLVGTHVDITDRRRAERALADSEARYRFALAATNLGTWHHDLATNLVRLDRRAADHVGCQRGELFFPELTCRIHPDDRERVAQDVAVFLDPAVSSGRYATEHRVVHDSGEVRWLSVQAHVDFDGAGASRRPLFATGTTLDVTERKRAEQALRESEEHYRSLFDNMLNGYAYCRMLFEEGQPQDFIYLHVNRAFETLTGLKDVVGKNATTVIPGIREADLQLIETYGRVALSGIPERFETYVEALAMWFSIAVYSPRKEYFVAVFDVITERKRAEQAVHESEALLSGIVDSAMDGIITVDEAETILVFNTAAEKIFGCPATIAIGQPLERFIPERLRGAYHRRLRRFGQTDEAQDTTSRLTRVSGLRADGEELPIEASISRVEVDGHMLSTIILRDVTDRVRGEEERARLEAQLRLAQKMEALGTLAGGVAHDFNNILGAIIGNVDLAAQDVGGEHPAVESLNEIRKASHRAKDLVQRILAFSRRQPQPQRVISLCPILEEAVTLLRASLPAAVELAVTFDADTPTVLADPTQIHQVLMNLCTNAWQALDGEAWRIDVRLAGVTLDAASAATHPSLRPGRFACLSVTDSGMGMEPVTLERIFEPFFTTKPVGEGTGLGLSVVHGIVKAHGGTVTVTSQRGKGTTFSLYFPAAHLAEPAAPPAPAALGLSRATNNHHILYLDDEEALVFLVTRTLERLGYRVSGYTRPEDALAAVQADPGQFDLVVTDLNMPGHSGLEVARELARLRPDLPVVLASGYLTEELRAAAPQVGVRQLIYKPNTVEELCAVVQRLLVEQRSENESGGHHGQDSGGR